MNITSYFENTKKHLAQRPMSLMGWIIKRFKLAVKTISDLIVSIVYIKPNPNSMFKLEQKLQKEQLLQQLYIDRVLKRYDTKNLLKNK